MEKLSKTSRVVNRFVKIVRGLCIGFGIACIVLLVIAIVLPESQYYRLVNLSDMSVTLGNVEYHLTRPLEPTGPIRPAVCMILFSAAVSLGLGAWGLGLLYQILAPMAEQRPFEGSVSANLKRLGWVSLAAAVFSLITEPLMELLSMKMFDLEQLFAPGLIAGYTVEGSVELSLFLVPALLFILSYVFQYGEELQRQSDETL